MAKSRVVRTRHITIVSPAGERLKQPVWSRARLWRKYRDLLPNLRRAIDYAREVLAKQRIGTVVYIGDVPVYHCKWGDGRAFKGWKANPVAEYWRKRLSRR